MLKLKSRALSSFTALTAGLVVGTLLSSCGVRPTPTPLSSEINTDIATTAANAIRKDSASPDSAESTDALSSSANSSPNSSNPEISPEDFAKEYGLPENDDQPFAPGSGFSKDIPQTRVVAPENFKNFRVNVDIFRRSTKRPILGEFRDEYTPALVPNAAGMSAEERTEQAKKKFAILAGREFAVASLDGVPFKAYIISAAIEQKVAVVVKDASGQPVIDPATGQPMTRMSMKTTPPGNYRLDALAYDKKFKQPDGSTVTTPVAFPWIKSAAYNNSQMFWGLWIKGGYFIHSTPHYGELGRPASMGCIRQSFPDAQELFKLMVEDGMTGMIRIHTLGAKDSVSRLREIVLDLGYKAPADAPVTESPKDPSKDMNWVLGQLQTSYQHIRDSVGYYGTELEIVGHSWLDETGKPAATKWPTCGQLKDSPIDCFKAWTVRKPKNSQN
jgi:hypothetical protein